jgi:hypothetical protein
VVQNGGIASFVISALDVHSSADAALPNRPDSPAAGSAPRQRIGDRSRNMNELSELYLSRQDQADEPTRSVRLAGAERPVRRYRHRRG